MSTTEIANLKAVVVRHLEAHNRLPTSLAIRLLEALEELERALYTKAAA